MLEPFEPSHPRALLAAAALSLAVQSCGASTVQPVATPSADVPSSQHRIVLTPDRAVFVSSDRGPLTARELSSVVLGASSGPAARILLHFSLESLEQGAPSGDAVTAAFLVLDRASGASAGPGEVTLGVSAIDELWSAGPSSDRSRPSAGMFTTWARPPSAHLLETGTVVVATRAFTPIRVEVTAFARGLLASHGVGARSAGLRVEALVGAATESNGVALATGGAAGEVGPRLEIYVSPAVP